MSSRFYDMSYPQYTVHDVSALTGLTPQTIRYYDSIGVVVPQRGAQRVLPWRTLGIDGQDAKQNADGK